MRRTSPSPLPEASASSSPQGSRARFWAARLVLLVACASVVATSQPTSDDVFSNEHVGEPLRLTTEAPRVTRRLVVRASAPKPPSKQAEGELVVRARARWTPADPGQTVNPWLKVILTQGTNSTSGPRASAVLEPGETSTVEGNTILFSDCNLQSACVWTVDVTFEVQANVGAGTVELDWTAQAGVRVVDTDEVPKGFSVSVSEP
ncbi:hypothetical protein G4177_34325 [Corallococcus sp. ZKHCc1 1396]|uniref:DUF2381 family protein n=1 Tax=Corallococcus soli TaxID=2710757 RepID=A0ABR9PZC5_9BACT|nr:hypothetical protein [Corallococcus soli]MBE4753239.1 hypothetical protein [Corallococcus soli]